MNRSSFDIKKMAYIIVFVCINLLLYALTNGNAFNWYWTVHSTIPVSLVLTSFLHFGFNHLFSNMYGMLVFGWVLTTCMTDKKAKGPTLPLLFIIASVVTGILPYYLHPQVYTAGASGTAYALEAYVFTFAFAGGNDSISVLLKQQSRWLISNAVISVLWFFNTEVSFIGHFSGAVVGVIVAFIDLNMRRKHPEINTSKNPQIPTYNSTSMEFVCPTCGQVLRVPRGKGKIIVTCTKCKNKFMAST